MFFACVVFWRGNPLKNHNNCFPRCSMYGILTYMNGFKKKMVMAYNVGKNLPVPFGASGILFNWQIPLAFSMFHLGSSMLVLGRWCKSSTSSRVEWTAVAVSTFVVKGLFGWLGLHGFTNFDWVYQLWWRHGFTNFDWYESKSGATNDWWWQLCGSGSFDYWKYFERTLDNVV